MIASPVDHLLVKAGGGQSEWRRRLGVHPAIAVGLLLSLCAFAIPKLVAHGAGRSVLPCQKIDVAPVAGSTLAELRRAIASSGVAALSADGTVDAEGLQQPWSSWSDAPPSGPARGAAPAAAVTDGYEIRWWSQTLDHQVADLFVFRSAGEAASYVAAAASTQCHAHAVGYRLAEPAGARALIWTNPDGFREADVYFSRGARAFRMVDVPPATYMEGPFRLNDTELIGMPQLLACRMAQAGCEESALEPSLSAGGYVALEALAAAGSQLRLEPMVRPTSVIGHACVAIARIRGPEAAMLYEGCQVTLHILNVSSYDLGCSRAKPCQQWAIGAAAGDLYRAAAIEGRLAARLRGGACRSAWRLAAANDAQLGAAFVLYGQMLVARNPLARRAEQLRADRLSQQADSRPITAVLLMSACAPRGVRPGPSEPA